MKKVTLSDYGMFVADFDGREDNNERFGQAFINVFYSARAIHPDIDSNQLFYAEDREESISLIFKSFIDYN